MTQRKRAQTAEVTLLKKVPRSSEPETVSPCMYLGIRQENAAVYGFSHDLHRCYWGGYRLRLTAEHQEQYCLHNRFAQCPVALTLMPRPVDGAAGIGRMHGPSPRPPLWKRLFGLR